MIPILCIDDHQILVGPWEVDLRRMEARASGWPEWMEEMFPHPLASLSSASWSPRGYSSTADGGLWLIEAVAVRGESTRRWVSALFLSRDGRLAERVDLPRYEDLRDSGVLVFQEWSLVHGALLLGHEVVRPTKSLSIRAVNAIVKRMVCLGSGGALVFPDGGMILPDGTESRLFDPVGVSERIREATRGAVISHPPFGIDVLGWDGRNLWILAGPEAYEVRWRNRFAIASIRPFMEKTVAEIAYIFESSIRPPIHRLHDGGWVVQAAGNDRVERWIYLLPGHEEIRVHEQVEDPDRRVLYGMMFVADRRRGLIALVEVTNRSQERSVMLHHGDGEPVHIFPGKSSDLLHLLSRGWVPVREADGGVSILCGSWADMHRQMERLITTSDLKRELAEIAGTEELFLYGILARNGLLMAYGLRLFPQATFLVSFRVSGGRLIPIRSMFTKREIRFPEAVDDGELLSVLFSGDRDGLWLVAQMADDGSITLSCLS